MYLWLLSLNIYNCHYRFSSLNVFKSLLGCGEVQSWLCTTVLLSFLKDTFKLARLTTFPKRSHISQPTMFGEAIHALFGGGDESPSSPNRSAKPFSQTDFDSPSPGKWQSIIANEPSTTRSGKLFSPEVRKPSAANTDPEPVNEAAAAKHIRVDDSPLSQRKQKQPRKCVITDSTTIFGVRAEAKVVEEGAEGVEALKIFVQTSLRGPYIAIDNSEVKQLREMGHGALLDKTCDEALNEKTGKATNPVAPGSKKNAAKDDERQSLQPVAEVAMTASRHFCTPDSLFNCIANNRPDLFTLPNFGKFLRETVCDANGRANMKDLYTYVNEHGMFCRFNLASIKTKQSDKAFMDHRPQERLPIVIEMCKNGEILVVQFYRKGDMSIEHTVGLANGFAYCNDAATGGKFNVDEYADKYMDGVHMARVVMPFNVQK